MGSVTTVAGLDPAYVIRASIDRRGAANVVNQGVLPPGTVLGKYRVVRLIGEGGMGAVYEAEHVDLGKPVAL